MRVPRLRASPRHGGARTVFYLYVMIRRGGVPSGAAAFIAGAGLALPDSTEIVQLSWETLRFQQIANHLFSERAEPVTPNRPCALRWCCITVSGVIAPGGGHSGRDGGITCRRPKTR